MTDVYEGEVPPEGDGPLETPAMKAPHSQGRIVIKPGRLNGQPTIGDSRLHVRTVVNTYLEYGYDETTRIWPYLTETDVKLACWFWSEWVGEHNADCQDVPLKTGFCTWVSEHRDALLAGDWEAVPMPPRVQP